MLDYNINVCIYSHTFCLQAHHRNEHKSQYLPLLHEWATKTLPSPHRGFISDREGCLGAKLVFASQECACLLISERVKVTNLLNLAESALWFSFKVRPHKMKYGALKNHVQPPFDTGLPGLEHRPLWV